MDLAQHVPDYVHPPPCPLSILMVTDKDGSFQQVGAYRPQRSFHLLIESLNRQTAGWATLTVGKAHRSSADDPASSAGTMFGQFAQTADSGLRHFRFGTNSLQSYDEVWLFGIQNTGEINTEHPALSRDEVTVIDRFMGGGGGLFATGDHWTFGTPLCGAIPRVREMREWQPDAVPPDRGPGRLDTRVDTGEFHTGYDDQYDNEYERDAVPQRIYCRLYGTSSSPTTLFWRGYPHPLLCGPRGAIQILPDHMHEGRCEVPASLGDEFQGIAPEIIAYGQNHAGGHESGNDSFGLINAYNGDDAGLGRVVVQSTWHHFIYLNTQGFAAATDPVGRRYWDDIQAYYRNLAIWLAPPAKRRRLFEIVAWYARWHERTSEILSRYPTANPTRLVDLGRLALDVIGRDAPQCWIFESLINRIGQRGLILDPHHLSPWNPHPAGQMEETLPLYNLELFYAGVLGAVLHRIYQEYPSLSIKPAQLKKLSNQLPKLVDEGVQAGLVASAQALGVALNKLTAFQQALARPK